MSMHITDGEAFHALHLNRISKRHDGWGVYDLDVGNCAVVINTGNLGTGTGTLTVQPGDALLNGTDAVIAEQIINIPQADTAPRKDAVVLYPDGSAGREAGTPEPKTPTSRELKRSERPAPPDLSTVDCVPLAIINVPEGATAITANEIVDVRPPAFVGGGGGGETAASISGRYPETGTITADGTTSSFTWTVESPATLSMALAGAATSDASTDFSTSVDDAANTITVSYATAPTGELAWNWAANVSITEVETVTHGAASHDPSVADQADLEAHTTNVSNPHTTTAEQTRLAGNTVEGTLRSALGADAYRELVDSSGGTVTDPYTLRFHDRDWRLVAAGVGGIGDAVRVSHDSGDMTLGGGITANGSGYITGDLTVDGNIVGVVEESELERKADKDGGGTGTLSNYAAVDSDSVRTDSLQDGSNPAETISGTGATLSFSGNTDRDIHDATDVSLANGTTASVTEDVTVNYYEGIDATGTLIASETQSITLAAGASSTTTFLSDDFGIGVGDYFIDVTTANLTVDSVAEHTLGASYTTEQDVEGDLVTVDQNGRERARYDATSSAVSYPAVETGDARISGATPGIRLSGTELNAEDLTIRENAGTIELYDEGVGAVAGSWDLSPDLAIGNTTHAATDHESGGSLEVTHNNLAITSSDHHARPAAGTLLSEDAGNNFNVDIATDTASASGDGTTVTFTLPHSLGVIPTVAHVQPTSADAAGSFYVSAKTGTGIDVTYNTAPATGTGNLTFDIITA